MTCATTTLPDPGEVDVSALRARYQEERNRRMRLDGQNQYDTADESDAELQHEDPHMPYVPRAAVVEDINVAVLRSEEHTSETPVTNAHLVCRLLLEKTTTQTTQRTHNYQQDTNTQT